MHFTLITEQKSPIAIICDAAISTNHLLRLYQLLPDRAQLAQDLSIRWQSGPVLCCPEWAAAQRKRRPMLKPTGHRLAFLATLAFAICHLSSAIAAAHY